MNELEMRLMNQIDDLMVELKRANQTIELQAQEISLLREQVAEMNRRLFGRKKESFNETPGQMGLFDTDPFTKPELTGEESQEETVVKEHRRFKRKGLKKAKLDGLPTNDIHYQLASNECQCQDCGSNLHNIGSTIVRKEPRFIPAQIIVDVFHQHAYACRNCEQTKNETKIVKANVPKPLLNNSLGTPSIVTETIIEKYQKYVPNYRQEKIWANLNFPINRKEISNWHIKVVDYVFKRIYSLLHQELLTQEVAHADETSFRVLDSEKVKDTIWLFLSGASEDRQVILYEHASTRGGVIPQQFLAEYKGYLMTDGYKVYQSLSDITNVACLAHIRRKFFEAAPIKNSKKSFGKFGAELCSEIFKKDHEFDDLPYEIRKEKREKELRPLIDEFYEWMASISYLPKSKLGLAIEYAFVQKPFLYNIFEDGRLELSNNRAERAVKQIVMGRKNWLFSKSTKGAKATGIIMSIVQTAIHNGVDVRKYLNFLLTSIPQLPTLTDKLLRESYLPWSPLVQQTCK
ncbi:MAG: IS66 family transposase [Streptococcaceae bacterium]|nr:IS66 family transposase [Streptococcaceae bacterium]